MADSTARGSWLPRRRRRVLLATSAGLVAVLAAVWAVLALRAQQPLPVRAPGSWVFAIDIDPPSGWTVRSRGVTADLDSISLRGELGECGVIARLPSAPQAGRIPPPETSEPVRVNGRPASYSTAYRGDYDGEAGVRLTYGEGGVLDVVCDVLPPQAKGVEIRTVVLDIAERLRFSTGTDLILPMTLSQLPPDFEIASIQYQDGASQLLLTPDGDLSRPERAVGVEVTPRKPPLDWQPTTVDGAPAELWLGSGAAQFCRPVQHQYACVQLTDMTIPLEDPNGPAARRGTALVSDLMQSLRFATDVGDRDTWFDAETALPR